MGCNFFCRAAKRWEMALMLFSGIMLVYTLRVNMSVAAQKMKDELNWSDSEKGYMLSAFYWGYAIGQVPASRLAQVYGAKWIFGLSVLIPSALTLLVPLACRESFTVGLLVRAAIGLFESASFPAVYHFLPIWIPVSEKTIMIPSIYCGMYMGEIIAFSISGVLASADLSMDGHYYGGWQLIFYTFGFLGLAWFPFWAWFSHETPEDHPTITAEERALINKGKSYKRITGIDESLVNSPMYNDSAEKESSPFHEGQSAAVTAADSADEEEVEAPRRPSKHDRIVQHSIDEIFEGPSGLDMANRVPWLAFFTHPASLALFINNWTYGFIGFMLLSEMPSYMNEILGFGLEQASVLCIFPYVALLVATMSFGKLFIHMEMHHNWPVRRVRQVAHFIAMGGSSVVLVACGFLEDKYAAFGCLILTQVMMGAAQSSIACAYSDVAPNYSSALNSVGNMIGAIAGILGPIVVALFTDAFPGRKGWQLVFFLTAAQSGLALIVWYFYQTSDIVPELNNPTGSVSRKY